MFLRYIPGKTGIVGIYMYVSLTGLIQSKLFSHWCVIATVPIKSLEDGTDISWIKGQTTKLNLSAICIFIMIAGVHCSNLLTDQSI